MSNLRSYNLDADHKVYTATYTSADTITLNSSYPTISNSAQVVYIKQIKADSTSRIWGNALYGVTIVHSGGVLTVSGAGSPFVSGDVYEVGINGMRIGDDEDLDLVKTSNQTPSYAHYTDSQNINETNLGIDSSYNVGTDSSAFFTNTGTTYTPETIAEGYKIYNITQVFDASINTDTHYGYAGDGGAGYPTADDISHVLADDGSAWTNGDIASISEVKRFEIDAASYTLMSVDVHLDSKDEHNACFCKIYGTNDSSTSTVCDDNWKDMSTDIFGADELYANGITDASRAVTEGLYIVDTPSVISKYMLKIVGECDNGVQNNVFNINVRKGY